MRLIAISSFALAVLSGAAGAETNSTGKIVWDAGIVATADSSHSRFNEVDEIHVAFSPVQRSKNGKVESVGKPITRRHMLGNGRRNSTTFRDLALPSGEYVLSQVGFREDYTAFCLMEKTLLVSVEAGKTQYLGQFHFNEPSSSPNLNADSYVPIHGMTYDLESARENKHWQFGTAQLAELEPVVIDPDIGTCHASSINVAAW